MPLRGQAGQVVARIGAKRIVGREAALHTAAATVMSFLLDLPAMWWGQPTKLAAIIPGHQVSTVSDEG